MGHSKKCSNLATYWDRSSSRCVQCEFSPGREVTANCGHDDEGGLHEPPTVPCKSGTFNDGSLAKCQNCTSCPPGYNMTRPCSATADSQCQELRIPTTSIPFTFKTSRRSILTTTTTTKSPGVPPTTDPDKAWALPLAILIFILLVAICAFVIYRKRKGRVQETGLAFNKRSSYMNAGFSSLSAAPSNTDIEDTSSAIMSAPLQTVLDNLDVLEELVILLDPEIHAVKNTKHLASLCNFPSPWITYTYSMKDSKSPLKAVLEGVTSKHPEWTVGHLAKLLRQMERNDAVALLAKLRVNDMDV